MVFCGLRAVVVVSQIQMAQTKGATTHVFEDVPDDSVFQREYDRYKLDTSTVTERSLGDEFRHVLSIIHRYIFSFTARLQLSVR